MTQLLLKIGILLGTLLALESPKPIQAYLNIPIHVEPIAIVNVNNLVQLGTLTLTNSPVLDVIFTEESDAILFVTQDGGVYKWRLENNLVDVVMNIEHPVFASFNANGTQIVCQCGMNSPVDDLRLFSLTNKSDLALISDFGPTSDVRFSADGKRVIAAGGWTREESVIQVMDIDQPQPLIALSENDWTSKAAFNPSNANVIAVGYAHSIDVWDIEQHLKRFTLEQDFPISPSGALVLPIGDLAFSADGSQLASMSTEGYVWLWDTNDGERKQFFQDDSLVLDTTQILHLPSDCELVFSPTSQLLVTTNNDQIRLWNASTGELLRTINEKATNLAFNSKGTLFATADNLGTVTVWGIS